MYIGLHNHTAIGSNIRGFLDSTNRVEEMVKYAKELGMGGIAITDHDSLTAHIDLLHYVKALKEQDEDTWANFKPICGNEIYLVSRKTIEEDKDYSSFYHFILIAKDMAGYQQLRNLSTKAWCENFFTYVNPRTPTYFDDLFAELEANPNHLIGCTACLGGQLDKLILKAYRTNQDYSKAKKFIETLKQKFGEGNFYLEMQPSYQEDQIIVNSIILQLSKETGTPYIITTDAHYLKAEDREVHKYFLLSDDNGKTTREVDGFYDSTYMMSEDEIHKYMDSYLGQDAVDVGLSNSIKIANMCEFYSLDKPLEIPYKAFDIREPNEALYKKFVSHVPLFKYFYESKYDSDRHMCRDLLNRLEERPEELQNQKTYDAINECLEALITSSEAQNVRWSGYLLVCKELIKTVWESNSLCGPGRGSGVGFILLYLLDITQVNPLWEDTQTYAFRFLHKYRSSVLDIDFDSEGSKKDLIIENLRKKYGGYNHVTKVQTIGTAKSKKALQIAARALGYTPEEGVYISSFIKSERGIMYTLSQTYYGDPDNNIPPDTEFRNLMDNQYKDVWKIAQKIEGLPVAAGSHAGGVILSVKNISDSCPLMRTRSGDIITQVDLHRAEDMGLIKYDVLNIDALEKIHIELDLLLEDNLIEWQGSLKDTYEKYLGVYNIERNNKEIWELINNHEIISLFQWEKESGWACIEKGKPSSLVELTALNSVMRLMPQAGQLETPLEIYSRHRKDITTWYQEMDDFGLTKEEQEVVKKYALESYGLLPSQESFMIAVQDPELGGWDLLFADKLRKAVAKKRPKDFIELEHQYFERAKERNLSIKLCQYIWNLISMNKGYSFNNSHVLAYSIVALQEANLAYHYPIIYWNAANLISDSGGMDGTVNYGKNAAAIGRMRKEGINIVPPYINEARFGFKPDAKNNEIVFGLKAISGIGAAAAQAIVTNQPYTSAIDFYNKMEQYKAVDESCKFGDAAMIQLIKAGSFDKLEKDKTRIELMEDFIGTMVTPVKKLQYSHLSDIARLGLLPEQYKKKEYRFYRFREYIFNKDNIVRQDGKSVATAYYKLDRKFAEPFFIEHFESDLVENKDYYYTDDGFIAVKRGAFDKVYDKKMVNIKTNVLDNPDILKAVNADKINQVWENKCGSRDISKWEMESLNYYYTKHELTGVNQKRYNIIDFDKLSPDSAINSSYFIKGVVKPRYQLSRICGTVIDKDKSHSTVTLLTPSGVVVVRYYKGQFGFYDREITEITEDGKKRKLEPSWFKRGSKLLITGFRSDEFFIPKIYKDSIYKHSTQLILDLMDDGQLLLQSERIGNVDDESEAIGKTN